MRSSQFWAGAFFLTQACSGAFSQTSWQSFTSAESGFSVRMPATPVQRLEMVAETHATLRIYEARTEDPATVFTVQVGMPDQEGNFGAIPMSAFLEYEAMSRGEKAAGTVSDVRPISFQGKDGISYRTDSGSGATRTTVRGITFLIDGGFIRLTTSCNPTSPDSGQVFDRFRDSFKLTPIKFVAAPAHFVSSRGIRFLPPAGWQKVDAGHPDALARYMNQTQFLTLLAASDAEYTCAILEGESRASGRISSAESVVLDSNAFRRMTGRTSVAEPKLDFTIVQYCLDTPRGVVVLSGGELESGFWRWAAVFEGAARSIRLD